MRNYTVWKISCALTHFKRNLKEEGKFQAIKSPIKKPRGTLWGFRFCVLLLFFYLSFFFPVNRRETWKAFVVVLLNIYETVHIYSMCLYYVKYSYKVRNIWWRVWICLLHHSLPKHKNNFFLLRNTSFLSSVWRGSLVTILTPSGYEVKKEYHLSGVVFLQGMK